MTGREDWERRGRVMKGLAVVVLVAAASVVLVRADAPPYRWAVALLGDDDPRLPFVLIFLGLLAPVVIAKVVWDRRGSR
ncbi:MAG TPA: hypothetical protein RMH99_17375 [Sandaracinaceae bacterium LLY-WYZ-13_1]|nr:hypothetical protein [Sandaracinaceae bacterium LLY-WYZ-13_1]